MLRGLAFSRLEPASSPTSPQAVYLEFRYTPKPASRLNTAEIVPSILSGQCLDRRVPQEQTLVQEIPRWEKELNEQRATVS